MIKDIGAATALLGQAISLTAAFQGHPWQIDSHMLFFALLACLIFLRSVPALLTGTALTAVHHLSLAMFLPAMVYPDGGTLQNLGRTILHAIILLLETAVLVVTVLVLKKMEGEMRDRNSELESALAGSEKTRADAARAPSRRRSATTRQ
ncbi:MAG: hypothetical protein AAF636_16250 [Pseudomonadota bacterium]